MDSSVSPITKTLIVLMSLSSWIYQLLITNFILSVKKSTENGYEPTFSPDIDHYLHKRNHGLLLNTSKTGRARTLVLRNKLKHLELAGDGKQQAKQHKMHPLVSNPIFLFSLRLLVKYRFQKLHGTPDASLCISVYFPFLAHKDKTCFVFREQVYSLAV